MGRNLCKENIYESYNYVHKYNEIECIELRKYFIELFIIFKLIIKIYH